MSRRRKIANPEIKTQEEIFEAASRLSLESPESNTVTSNALSDKINSRVWNIKESESEVEHYIGLLDIDSAIKFYFDNIIKLQVKDGDNIIKVPVEYGSPEKWVSARRNGYYHDQQGKALIPLLMYRRTSIDSNRELGRNLDANNPQIYWNIRNLYTKENQYDRFSVLNGVKKVQEIHTVIVPEYVNISYECMIWTDYMTQMNKIIEAIKFAEGSYWGDPDKFRFYSYVDSFNNDIEISEREDRTITTNFNLTLQGYIVPEAIQKELVQKGKIKYTVGRIRISESTEQNPFF